MGISPLQFKHIDSGQNWYLRGEANLEYRLGQALSLQPDMLELQTWNDAGESHYMGNIWPEPISGSVIPDYTDGYDHTGYWQVLPSFIQAWKRGDTGTADTVPTNGAAAQGVFWHHTQLVSASCAPDQLGIGEPSGYQNAEDLVSVSRGPRSRWPRPKSLHSLTLFPIPGRDPCCKRPDWSHCHCHERSQYAGTGDSGGRLQQVQLQRLDDGRRFGQGGPGVK